MKKQQTIKMRLDTARAGVMPLAGYELTGRITGVAGLAAEIRGLASHVTIGNRLQLERRDGGAVAGEVIGFRAGNGTVMTFGSLEGLGPGSPATCRGVLPAGATPRPTNGSALHVSDGWLGRVIDPLGQPLDGQGPLPAGTRPCLVRPAPLAPTRRARLGERIDLGVRAMNLFVTCRRGQRLGLFAGSGIGKSTLLAMLARHVDCDVAVIALVGERGREVREFIESDLGAAGLSRSVVVVATSDTSPVMRREAAYTAMAVAEHFRDRGQSVLMLMDSVTRFCLALREIGLSAGEPPATRGYPPSVFAELPRLLERAGPGEETPGRPAGHISAIFTVLVEGDDHNEPVADAVRGILDGHVVLDRRIAERGRYPAIDVLRSLSRTMPGCNSDAENDLIRRARAILALNEEVADLVRLGAYRAGGDKAVDEAIRVAPGIDALLGQAIGERAAFADGFARLAAALEAPSG